MVASLWSPVGCGALGCATYCMNALSVVSFWVWYEIVIFDVVFGLWRKLDPVWCRWLAYLPFTQDTRVRVPVPEEYTARVAFVRLLINAQHTCMYVCMYVCMTPTSSHRHTLGIRVQLNSQEYKHNTWVHCCTLLAALPSINNIEEKARSFRYNIHIIHRLTPLSITNGKYFWMPGRNVSKMLYCLAPTGNRTQGKCLEGIYVTTTPLVLLFLLFITIIQDPQ